MFVCRLDYVFGVGNTLMESFEDMVENMDLSADQDSPDPHDCEFFEQIPVDIQETKTWSIEPLSDWDIEEE